MPPPSSCPSASIPVSGSHPVHRHCAAMLMNTTAGSTGRRNTGVKSLCWCFKLQGLTWSFVELTRHVLQIGLRVHGQVGSFGKVLSQQAIGVFVRSPLPRALRIAEVNIDVGR